MPESYPLETESHFAQALADAARVLALAHFRQPLAVELKSDLSPVTLADRAIEAELRRLIHARHPDHGIYGEEFGREAGSEYTWVIDPIDGTRSFICGVPQFGTLIALLLDGAPVLGVIDMPALGERWLGCRARTTKFQGAPASTSARVRVADARIITTSPDAFERAEDWRRYDALSRRAATRRFGGDCHSYGLLASGHCELVVEAGLQPYDFLALVPVIEGAGGRITDWSGAPLSLASDGRVIAAANDQVWREALDALA